jgi:flagellar basal-body rod protein FlgG
MNDALYIAATGMQTQQLGVDTIANNIANVNTPGFKKGRVEFTEIVLRQAGSLGALGVDGAGGPLAEPTGVGFGTGVAAVSKVFELGDVKQTGSAFDVAILGDGFLEVTMPDGSSAFSRGGTLRVNADGLLADAAGHPLRPGISVPSNATGLVVDGQGRVLVGLPGRQEPQESGQLELVRFANPGGLVAEGDGIYRASARSGEPIPGRASEDGLGAIAQGYLEGSNVKMIDELVGLMLAQRAYEANVKVVQAADEMLGLVNGLRR